MVAPNGVGRGFYFVLYFYVFTAILCSEHKQSRSEIIEDILLPYNHLHGPSHSHRFVRECQPVKYQNATHEIYPAHVSYNKEEPVLDTYYFVEEIGEYSWDKKQIYGHYFTVNDPVRTLSVLEQKSEGGCASGPLATVEETVKGKHCFLATNAGFFNTTEGYCFGNIISDGEEIQNSGGIQNAHFGIRKDGTLFFGYLPKEEVSSDNFLQLIGGVVWLVRNGEKYIETSKQVECSDFQETGTFNNFVDVKSARLAIGHDKEGRVIIVPIDGQTWERGLNLNQLADLLISWGIVNAINLDGGGSVTVLLNETLVNYPGNICKVNGSSIEVKCAREVASVLCVHEPYCLSRNCSGHGDCINGKCHCHGYWAGPSCDYLWCGVSNNCSMNGKCTENGCECNPGWTGQFCENPCPNGTYGLHCFHQCNCHNDAVCNPTDGSCECTPGYTGYLCDQMCPYGLYGQNCYKLCYCDNSCTCDHVTGSCNVSVQGSSFWQASQCLANQVIRERHLVVDQPDQYRLWLITIITLAIVCACSIILNISLLCITCACRCSTSPEQPFKKIRKTYAIPSVFHDTTSSCSSDDESFGEEIALQQLKPKSANTNEGTLQPSYKAPESKNVFTNSNYDR